MKEKFKYKIGDIVYHKTDNDKNYKFIIVTRVIVEGVEGKKLYYSCNNLILGVKDFLELTLTGE